MVVIYGFMERDNDKVLINEDSLVYSLEYFPSKYQPISSHWSLSIHPKTLEYQRFSEFFGGYRKRPVA